MKPDVLERVKRHGEQLNAIFHTTLDPVTLCRKLRRIEAQAGKVMLDYCNGSIDLEQVDPYTEKTLDKLDKLLNFRAQNVPVFINRDPRGYALKIESEYARDVRIHRDWGGYGIIAPDLSEAP